MLQIIGWLLCVYLVVKGFELIAMKQPAASVGAALAFLAAPIFFFMINEQSKATSTPFDQIGDASTYGSRAAAEAQVEADAAAADAAVDNALEAADRAIDNAMKAADQ